MADTFSDGARRVRAKVYVSEVAHGLWGDPSHAEHMRHVEKVTLRFVNGNDPDSENAKFWDASPSAEPISMTIANPGAQGVFHAGQEYYIDFVEAVRVREP